MHRTGRLIVLTLCIFQLATQIRAQAGAAAKPAQAETADYLEDSYGSYSYRQSGKGPYKEEKYEEYGYDDKEGSYGCEHGCPNPQPADSVVDAYLNKTTFVFAEVAERLVQQRLANNGTQSERTAGNPIVRHFPARKPTNQKALIAAARKSAAAMPVPSSKDFSEFVGQNQAGTSASTAGKAGIMSQPTVAASAGAEAHPAAVNNPIFSLPTSIRETGRGFEGASGDWIPTDQALAVGPHPMPEHKDTVVIVHAVNSVMKVFTALKNGSLSGNSEDPVEVDMNVILSDSAYLDYTDTNALNPTAFYDKKDKRFVVTWGTRSSIPGGPAPVLVCVSENANPLEEWTCWALESTIESQPSVPFCTNLGPSYFADYPQSSYSKDGLFISIRGTCLSPDGNGDNNSYLSAVFAFSKKALYGEGTAPGAEAGTNPVIYRAMYLPAASWYFSLPGEDQLLDFDDSLNAFNTYVLPARPQSAKDCTDPHFVMGKVNGNRYMSIAKLTKHSLTLMTSRDNAPRIYAAVLQKPDFSPLPGSTEGEPVIPQPEGGGDLDAGDVGDAGRTYGATFNKGRLYIATSEYFGPRNNRVPSIYYAIVDPSPKLCNPHIDRWGMVASEDDYALAYPSIAARGDGAVLGYSYGGDKMIALDGESYPAYAGFATSVVACDDKDSMITIAKRGEWVVLLSDTAPPLPWGQYSAVDFVDDTAWFAGAVALEGVNAGYGSFITNEDLAEH